MGALDCLSPSQPGRLGDPLVQWPHARAGLCRHRKTVVALHRAVHLARGNPEARVLLTTFSDPLAALLQDKLHRLIQGEPHLLERLDVLAMQELGERMHTAQLGKPRLIATEDLRALI